MHFVSSDHGGPVNIEREKEIIDRAVDYVHISSTQPGGYGHGSTHNARGPVGQDPNWVDGFLRWTHINQYAPTCKILRKTMLQRGQKNPFSSRKSADPGFSASQIACFGLNNAYVVSAKNREVVLHGPRLPNSRIHGRCMKDWTWKSKDLGTEHIVPDACYMLGKYIGRRGRDQENLSVLGGFKMGVRGLILCEKCFIYR